MFLCREKPSEAKRLFKDTRGTELDHWYLSRPKTVSTQFDFDASDARLVGQCSPQGPAATGTQQRNVDARLVRIIGSQRGVLPVVFMGHGNRNRAHRKRSPSNSTVELSNSHR
jgi:hypothetical protein